MAYNRGIMFIQPIIDKWSSLVPGLSFLVHREDNIVYVDFIYVPLADRRQGIASSILDEVLTEAVLNGCKVRIQPVDEFGTSIDILRTLYAGLGFKDVPGASYMEY